MATDNSSRVLQVIREHGEEGPRLDAEAIATRLGMEVAAVDAALEAFEQAGLVRLVPSMEMRNHMVQGLTARGRVDMGRADRDE
jgi:DNA-binding MarR family transcriptional regulator